MRGSDVRDPLISCADYHCSHSTRISAEQRNLHEISFV
jgi:hypothetical protein